MKFYNCQGKLPSIRVHDMKRCLDGSSVEKNTTPISIQQLQNNPTKKCSLAATEREIIPRGSIGSRSWIAKSPKKGKRALAREKESVRVLRI